MASGRSKEKGDWHNKHLAVRAKLTVSKDYRPWSCPRGKPAPLMEGVPNNPRYVDVLDIAWSSRKPKLRTLPFFCNISQCPSRAPWGTELKCLTTSSRVYDFSRDRLITAPEAMLLQGHPACDLDLSMFASGTLFTAVGEAMAAPSIATVMLAVYLNPLAEWWQNRV